MLEIMSSVVEQMSEGELLQMEKSRKLNVSEADYYKIIRKKTVALISACYESGAVASKQCDTVREKCVYLESTLEWHSKLKMIF